MSAIFNPLDHPDAEVSRAYFCQLTGRAKITAYRHERLDPNWAEADRPRQTCLLQSGGLQTLPGVGVPVGAQPRPS